MNSSKTYILRLLCAVSVTGVLFYVVGYFLFTTRQNASLPIGFKLKHQQQQFESDNRKLEDLLRLILTKVEPQTTRLRATTPSRPSRQTQTKILDSNHSKRIRSLKAFDVQITPAERRQIYDLIAFFDSVLSASNVSYLMYGGTLLGSFRHHDLIPWDDDIDVLVDVKDRDRLGQLFRPFAPHFTLRKAGPHDKLFSASGKRASTYSWLWPYVDISYFEANATHIWDIAKVYGHYYYYPKSETFPPHKRPFSNLSLPAPKDTWAFLVWSYGLNDSCHMFGYSHMIEGGGPHGRKHCSAFAHIYPFVHHYPAPRGIREVLRLGETTLSEVTIPEPVYAVADTYALKLKDGYQIPADVLLPKPTN